MTDGHSSHTSGAMNIEPRDLEHVFRDCFLVDYNTVLIGGGDEPLYLPSVDLARSPHRVIYREDYLASALHEVAHWCLAGAERRTREDYGYWYSPDGRNAEEQAQFERVEVGPQALEWILSDACGFRFHLSVDNLTTGVESSSRFESGVAASKQQFLARGLPIRAAAYQRALARLIVDRKALRSHRPLNLVNRQA